MSAFDCARATWADGRQALERLIQCKNSVGRHRVVRDAQVVDVESKVTTAALGGMPPVRLVHQDAPHESRGGREEVRTVLPRHSVDPDELQVGLVNQPDRSD